MSSASSSGAPAAATQASFYDCEVGGLCDLDERVLGALLFGVVSAARRRGLDSETALRRFAHDFAEQARRAGTVATGR